MSIAEVARRKLDAYDDGWPGSEDVSAWVEVVRALVAEDERLVSENERLAGEQEKAVRCLRRTRRGRDRLLDYALGLKASVRRCIQISDRLRRRLRERDEEG
jgi:hypothetical protein